MTRSARARAFEAEHGSPTPKPLGELVVAPDAESGTLLSFEDIISPRPPQPKDTPEVITLEADPILPETVMRAFANIVKTQNMRGRIQGVNMMDRMTGATNRFRTETPHSAEVRDHMDGKEIAFTKQTEETKKKPTDEEAAYDILNKTTERLLAGEDPAAVARSREYIKRRLEERLKTVPAYEVGTGDIPKPPMNAKIRNAIAKNPQAVRDLLDTILPRSL